MKLNPGPGKFIVVEGLDGAGTTTQTRLLEERLRVRGAVWATWEPTDRPAGLLIRRYLKGEIVTDPRALALLFAADRLDHVYGPEGILAHLERGEHVVCDRYYHSSLAYQTLDAGFNWVYRINSRALRPDLTVFIEVPVKYCLERLRSRQGSQKELFDEELERVRLGYGRALYRVSKDEAVQVVGGCGSIDEVGELIWERVQSLFDPTLVVDPQDQRRLARREGAPFLLAFRQRVEGHGLLSVRGMRRVEGGVEVEVDTPTDHRPYRIHLAIPGNEISVSGPVLPGVENWAALLEGMAHALVAEASGA